MDILLNYPTDHPYLDLLAFVTEFGRPLAETGSPPEVTAYLSLVPESPAPVTSTDQVRDCIRRVLRSGGYKPTGRGKPASEYLLRAAGDGSLQSINAAVDCCNAVSLHSGVPISVVDLERLQPFPQPPQVRVAIPQPDTRYLFSASGQEMDVTGLLCLIDSAGPCANAVKDSQRTKTSPDTRRTLSLLWGSQELPGRTQATFDWYRQLLQTVAGTVTVVSQVG